MLERLRICGARPRNGDCCTLKTAYRRVEEICFTRPAKHNDRIHVEEVVVGSAGVDETYHALVERYSKYPEPDLRVRRTRRGVSLENAEMRLELVGDEAHFCRYIFQLSKDAKDVMGGDGLALFQFYVEETMYSDSGFSAIWQFSTNKFNKAVIKEIPLEH